MNTLTPTEILAQLVTEGGAIVSSNDCSTMEIADAQACGRFAVDDEGLGYVRRYKEWLAKTKTDHKIIEEVKTAVEGYVDGAPDRGELANLANRVTAICEGKP